MGNKRNISPSSRFVDLASSDGLALSERIRICGVRAVTALVKKRSENIGGVISLQTRPPDYAKPEEWHPPRLAKTPQLFLTISDQAHHLPELPDYIKVSHPPEKRHISDVFDFVAQCSPQKNLLIHCYGGVHRSTAVALSLIAQEYGSGREDEAVRKLLLIRSHALPSLPLVKVADDFLQREGKLLAAVMNESNIAVGLADKEWLWRERALYDGILSPPLPPTVFVRTQGGLGAPARPNPLTYGKLRSRPF